MIQFLRKLFGLGSATDYAQLVKDGAIIIDVRSKAEYDGGHVKGSINIPVDVIANNLNKLKDKNKTIITCCASGMRSATAKSVLKSNGYAQVYNAGKWSSLERKF
jgi:phage shock protein E